MLSWAIARLRELFGPLRVAPLYRTAPVSPIPQAHFFNTVAMANLPDPTPDPREILMQIKTLERRTGRAHGPRNRPRTLDVDLLLFSDLVCSPGSSRDSDPALELTLPHPRMRDRRFVMAPLADLAPDLRLPPDGARVGDLLAALGSRQQVEKIEWSSR